MSRTNTGTDLPATLRSKTAPLLVAERAAETPRDVAYRVKKRGIYHERSWSAFRDDIHRCARGFEALGLAKGGRVAIMGDPCEEWAICDLAAQAAGGISYGIYPTASVAEVEYQMRDGGAAIFVAEDQEYVDKILPVADELPELRWIVVIDMTAMYTYDDPRIVGYEEVLKKGEEGGAPDAEAYYAAASALDPEAPAFIVYTSGTSGNPKGALIAHGRHLAGAYTIVDRYPMLREGKHRTVIYLPLSHVFGRDAGITLPLFSGLIPHYGEDIEDLPATLFEVAPTVLFAVPRYLQKFASNVLVGVHGSTWLKRTLYEAAMRYGRHFIRRRWAGRASIAERVLYRFMRGMAFRQILNKLGFDKLELVLAGGAALPTETTAFWQILGVPVVEVYGQTESGGAIIAGQDPKYPRPGDVGRVPAGWSVKLGTKDEILVKGADLFEGYWNNPDETKEVLDKEGWLHTGDVGAWEDGRLKIVDRLRDIMVTSGGKTLSPSYIENAIKASPYISEVAVFGHNRKFVTALIEIDFETVSDWARSAGIAYTGFTSLTEHPSVRELLREEIAQANQQLARVEQVKDFRILPKALDPEEEGEPVTPTRKVKRQVMYDRFKVLVEAMYDGGRDDMLAREVGEMA